MAARSDGSISISQTKGYLIKADADVYLNCAREIAANGEGNLARQRNKKSAVFTKPLPPDLSNYLYRVVQLNLNPEIEVFLCCLIDLLPFLVCHLSNSILNTIISVVKSSWTAL